MEQKTIEQQAKQIRGLARYMKSFKSVAELKKMAMQLDRADSRKVFVCRNGKTTPADYPDVQAVWNIDKDKLACVADKHYNIFQHQDFVETLCNQLSSLGLSAKGDVKNYGNVMICSVVLDKAIDVKGDKIALGFRVVNSYDKTTGVIGEFYGIRSICENGMVFRQFSATVHETHMTKKNVEQLILRLINNGAKMSDELRSMISESMADTFEWDMSVKLFAKLSGNKRWKKLLLEELAKQHAPGKQLTRWDIYNVLTAVATHNERVGKTMYEYLQQKAEKVLRTPGEDLRLLATQEA